MPTWHRDRMIIIGDAENVAAAFATYESLRRERVERVVAQGKRNGDGKTLGPVMRHVLPLVFTLYKPSEKSMTWLYGHRIDWRTPAVAA